MIQCVLSIRSLTKTTNPNMFYFLHLYQESEQSCIFVLGIHFALFYNFSIRFQNYSTSVVLFVILLDFRTILLVWYYLFFYQILELFYQCDIICFSIRFQNYSTSVVLFVFLLDFRTILLVWYYLFFYQILELFCQCGIICFSFYPKISVTINSKPCKKKKYPSLTKQAISSIDSINTEINMRLYQLMKN